MKIGTYYYPEQWPRDQWKRDFDNIARMGLQIVHMAEFAWFSLEPTPGRFDFAWLDECVEMARERKLDVILCTPTAAPPIWLTQQFPECLPIGEYGTCGRHGGRRHYSPTSAAMQEATRRIVTAMAEHFGKHPSVIGWQIDNEYGAPFDQSEQTHSAFRQWLRRKYGTIDALNRAWGNQFWNQYYTDFGQILMPTKRDPHYGNPHQCLDASRFWSWAFANFNRMQAEILRKHIGDRFITTNFMPLHADCNPADMAEDLTLFSWDSYPVSGWDRNPVDETFRIADPASIGLMHDQMRSYRDRWALMELQPGTINWSAVPVHVYPGAVRLWIWTAFAHGAEFVTTYRFRQPRFGIELFHHGLMQADGVTPSQGGREFALVIEEMRSVNANIQHRTSNIEHRSENVKVGLLLDFEQMWYYLTLPQARRWDFPALLRHFYSAVTRLGIPVEVIHPNRAWPDELAMVIAPGVQMIDEGLVRRLDEYASRGGNLVLTCRTGLMDRNGQLWEGPNAAPIVPLIGAAIDGYDVLPDDAWGHVEMDGKRSRWGAWADLVKPGPKTQVLATYADQFYKGTAAVTQAARGNGTVTYCGVFAEADFTARLVEKLAMQFKLPVTKLPERVQILRRGRYRICLNYQDATYEVPAPKDAKFVVGSRSLGLAGVAVWEE